MTGFILFLTIIALIFQFGFVNIIPYEEYERLKKFRYDDEPPVIVAFVCRYLLWTFPVLVYLFLTANLLSLELLPLLILVPVYWAKEIKSGVRTVLQNILKEEQNVSNDDE